MNYLYEEQIHKNAMSKVFCDHMETANHIFDNGICSRCGKKDDTFEFARTKDWLCLDCLESELSKTRAYYDECNRLRQVYYKGGVK